MRIASIAVIISALFTITACASAPGEWGTALERGAAHAAAEAAASEPARALLPADSVAMARYDASVGLWHCRLTDGSLRYSRTECVPQAAER